MPSSWAEVRRIFETALATPPEERSSYLAGACGKDPLLEAEVLRLLSSMNRMGDFLEQPFIGAAGALSPGGAQEAPPRRAVGPYRLLEPIGEGGMGVVYRALRMDQDYLRPVALKVIRRDMVQGPALRCFETERRIMGSLDHPHIARLLDGGSTEDGLPYFVMEYVRGQRIDRYFRDHGLDLGTRLSVLLDVCDAVSYAHRHLVVHRDLKPSNILVTETGEAKLLDFGIAKLLDAQDPESSATGTLVRMLTPDYASPEQVRGERITTATDVYSMGVLFYELLSDERPYRVDTITPEALTRAVCEQEPRRCGSFGRLPRDLACVVLKAMRKNPSERYASVDQLSEDLRRFTAGLPVEARRGSRAYYAGRYLKRYWKTAAVAATILFAVLGGTAATLWQARAALRQRAVAERRYRDLRRLANSMLMELDEAIVDLHGTMPARELVVRRAYDYLSALEQESTEDEDLRRELAVALFRMGELQRRTYGFSRKGSSNALQHFQRALEIRTAIARAHPLDLEDQDALADAHWRMARLLGQIGELRGHLAHAMKAVALHEELAARHPGWPEGPSRLAADYQTLGNAQMQQGAWQEALATFRRVADLREPMAHRPGAPETAQSDLAAAYRNLGRAMGRLGDRNGARRALAHALKLQTRLTARNSRSVWLRRDLLRAEHQYGHFLSTIGDHAGADRHLRIGVRLAEDLLASNPRNAEIRLRSAETFSDFGLHLLRTGRLRPAETWLRRALTLLEGWSQEIPGEIQVSVALAETCQCLGLVLAKSPSGLGEAEQCFRRSLRFWEELEAEGRLPSHKKEQIASLRTRLASPRS